MSEEEKNEWYEDFVKRREKRRIYIKMRQEMTDEEK